MRSLTTRPPLRTPSRPIQAGQLRAFLAVAQHLNFRAAADELSLTQSAVSRQIRALEDDVGVPLFFRHTRAVELSGAGMQLHQALRPALERIDAAVRLVRRSAGRRTVAISTWASFASMWLISRLEAFQHEHPDIDIRIDATDALVDLETTDVDVAIRYTLPGHAGSPQAVRLFGEQLTVVASPWLLKGRPIRSGRDLQQFTLLEASDTHRANHLTWLSWQRWLDEHQLAQLEPKRWLYFNYAHQIVQAALTGQGVALARAPLVADALARGDLVEVLPQARLDSPMAYAYVVAPRSRGRPEIEAFCRWLEREAQSTRRLTGELPDPDLRDVLEDQG